jgi:hypothetical protein
MAGWTLRGVGVAFFCALIYTSGVAQAATPPPPPLTDPGWACSSHAATVNVGGASGLTLDPLHANIDPSPITKDKPKLYCKDDGTTLPTLASHEALGPDTLSLDGNVAQAQTGLTNAGGEKFSQAPGAVGQLGNVDLNLGGGALHITAKAARAYVTGRCVGGANGTAVLSPGNPRLEPTGKYVNTGPQDGSDVAGQVLDLRINGMAIPAEGQPDAALDQLFTGLSPLAPIIRVMLNKDYRTTSGGEKLLTREAVRIELLTAPGSTPLITIVIGSSTVGVTGDPCHSSTVTSGGGGTPPALLAGGNEPGSNGGGLFGGNSSTNNGGGGTKTVFVNVGAPNGANASECAHIRVFFDLERQGKPSSSGPTALSSSTGIRHVIRGVVRNCKGQPITRAKIELVNIIHGKRHLVKTGLRTRAGGKFTMITPNNYTSRTLEFQYRAFVLDPKIAARKHLRIKVRNFRGQLT